MRAAAFGAATVSVLTGNMWLGLGAGIVVSTGMAMLHGLASITLKGNQIISGVAINFLAQGLTAVLGLSWFHQGGRTPPPPAGASTCPSRTSWPACPFWGRSTTT